MDSDVLDAYEATLVAARVRRERSPEPDVTAHLRASTPAGEVRGGSPRRLGFDAERPPDDVDRMFIQAVRSWAAASSVALDDTWNPPPQSPEISSESVVDQSRLFFPAVNVGVALSSDR